MGRLDRAESLQPLDACFRAGRAGGARSVDFDKGVEPWDFTRRRPKTDRLDDHGDDLSEQYSLWFPLLKVFDREIWYGEYVVLIAEKP